MDGGRRLAMYDRSLELCTLLENRIEQKDVLAVPLATCSEQFRSKSTVGLMLNGVFVDNMVIGGPAYNSGQLDKGDMILEVDGKLVSAENLHDAMLGSDVPSTSFTVKVRKAGSGDQQGIIKDLVLTRMATEVIADRRRMFELFTALKDRANVDGDISAADTVDDCIQLWTRMLIADSNHDNKIVENVKLLQHDCLEMLRELRQCLTMSVERNERERSSANEDHLRERAEPPPPDESALAENLQSRMDELLKTLANMISREQYDAELSRLQNQIDELMKNLANSIPKEQHGAEMARMQKQIEGMVLAAQYNACLDDVNASTLEITRLKKMIDSMVPSIQFQTSQDEVSRGRAEIEHLKDQLKSMVSSDEVTRLREELVASQKIIDTMFAKSHVAGLEDLVKQRESEISRLSENVQVETDRLQKLINSMIPKGKYDLVQDELSAAIQEVERLKKALADMVPRQELDRKEQALKHSQVESEGLKSLIKEREEQIEELRRSLKVTKDQLDKSQKELLDSSPRQEVLQARSEGSKWKLLAEEQRETISVLETQVSTLMAKIAAMVPKEDLQIAQLEVDNIRQRLKGMAPKSDLDFARSEVDSLSVENLRLQKLISTMISKEQYEAAQFKIAEAEAASERMRKESLNLATKTKSSLRNFQEDLDKLSEEMLRTQATIDAMVPKKQYDLSQEQLKAVRAEMQKVKNLLDTMVAKAMLDESREEVARLLQEIQSLRECLKGTVSKESVSQHKEELDALNAEIKRLQKLIDSMVTKAQHETAQEESRAEIQRLQVCLKTMVSKHQYDASQDEVSNAKKEIERLQKALGETVAKGDLASANDVIKRLQADVERLQGSIAAAEERSATLGSELAAVKDQLDQKRKELLESAPRQEVLQARTEASKANQVSDDLRQSIVILEAQISTLTTKIAAMVPKEDLQIAQLEVDNIRQRLKGMAPKSDLDFARSEVDSLSVENLRLQKLISTMISKEQYEAAQFKIAEAEAASERMRKESLNLATKTKSSLRNFQEDLDKLSEEMLRTQATIDAMVPKKQYDLSQEQLKAVRAEMQKVKNLLDTMVAKAKLDESREEVARLLQEIQSLRECLKGTVSKESVSQHKEELDALNAEIKRLQKLIDSMVTKAQHETAQEESRAEIQRLQVCLKTMVSKHQYDASQDEVSNAKKEIERLQKALGETVAKGDLASANDVIKRLQADVERLQGSIAAAEERSATLGSELAAVKDQLDQKRKELLESAPRQEVLQARTEASKARLDADQLRQSIAILEAQISTLTTKIAEMVPAEELAASLANATKLDSELASLKQTLAAAGLSDPVVLNRLVSALKAPPAEGPLMVSSLLELLKEPPTVMIIELVQFLTCLSQSNAAGTVFLSDVTALLQDLTGPVERSVPELRRIIHIMNQQVPMTAEQLAELRALLRGPPCVRLDDLKRLLLECSSLDDLDRMRAEIDALRRQLQGLQDENAKLNSRIHLLAQELTTAKVTAKPVLTSPYNTRFSGSICLSLISSDPSAKIFYSTDNSDPEPGHFEREGTSPLNVKISESCVLKAICKSEGCRASDILMEEFHARREQERAAPDSAPANETPKVQERAALDSAPANETPKVGGVGMLIERLHDKGHVVVKSLTEGGAAAKDGRIQCGDLLLSVDGQNVAESTSELVARGISGFEGTSVQLTLLRPAGDVVDPFSNGTKALDGIEYSVTLVRCAAGYIVGSPGRASGEIESPGFATRTPETEKPQSSLLASQIYRPFQTIFDTNMV